MKEQTETDKDQEDAQISHRSDRHDPGLGRHWDRAGHVFLYDLEDHQAEPINRRTQRLSQYI